MKKKILCLILAILMLIGILPLSVFASEIATAVKDSTPPEVRLSSLYSYSERYYNTVLDYEHRAVPDAEGNFYFDISLSKTPAVDSEIVVYYRTVDDSAVAKWGDYKSVDAGASVTLNKSNGYTARVVVESKVLDYSFYASPEYTINSGQEKDKLVSRRFVFELTSVEGGATLNSQSLYCYLRGNEYFFQQNDAQIKNSFKDRYDYVWSLVKNNNQYKSFFPKMQENKAKYEDTIKYFSLYYDVPWQSRPATPQIKYKGKYEDVLNIAFSDEMRSYVEAGWSDLGIAINGRLKRDYWDSDGPATFNLYYTYKGEKKLALTLNLEGEFDESTYFGWEHAYEYVIEERNDDEYADYDRFQANNRKDFVHDNFNGFVVYDNDGNVAYKVEADREDDENVGETDLYNQLNGTLTSGNVVKYGNIYVSDAYDYSEPWYTNSDPFFYYLKLPSNFIFADSYSYEFISDSTDEDEIRWLENVRVLFALLKNGQPEILEDEKGVQMISTNLDSIKNGENKWDNKDDPLRISVRFDRPVHIADPNNLCYITADIYSDKACIAEGVRLNLKQQEGKNRSGGYFHYACDTLVFEGELPDSVKNGKVYSIRNIKLEDGTNAQSNPTKGIRGYLTNESLISKTIDDIYNLDKDFRAPVAVLGTSISSTPTKAKSVDLYVNVNGESATRFNDYVTVYYLWSESEDIDDDAVYSSSVVFHTAKDGEVLKTIIGTGNGQMYLHLKAVSSYGKSTTSKYGPFNFDNMAPSLSADDIAKTGDLKDRTISIPLPNDNGGVGVKDVDLYYIKKNGEEALLKHFTANDFKDDPKTLTYTISHRDVGVGVDADGHVISAEEEIEFYWILTDNLGNISGKVAEFALVFDTNDYISEDIMISKGPLDFTGYGAFIEDPEMIADRVYLYDYKDNSGNTIVKSGVYYAFGFEIDGRKLHGDKKEYYDISVSYNGVPLKKDDDYTVEYRNVVTQMVPVEGSSSKQEITVSWQVTLLLNKEIKSGRYDIRLVRLIDTEGATKQVSQLYTVYATANQNDDTYTSNKVEFGTLLSNSVYQLSAEYPYFYYKDIDGAVQKVYYSDTTRKPASFSSFEKAKEYVYYRELSDIYLVKLTSATASALVSGTTGYIIAHGETVTPQADQYWIRYKSEAWTPTSGESSWVYYYYGTDDELIKDALSANLQSAINKVANRIVGYGKTVMLTDTSLFLGSTMGDKLLDEYGMPYLDAGQMHITDELSRVTMCANVWSTEVAFAADKNIFKSTVSVGVVGEEEYEEYPIVGNFALPEESIFQYMTYDQFKSGTGKWKSLNFKKGESFVDIFVSSGVYYIREISTEGIAIFAIYIDKEAPKVSFSNTDNDGNLKEIPIDATEVLEVRTKDLYIGAIAATEYDRLSYVSVYKVSNLSHVGTYTADDLASDPVKLSDGNYYIVVSDRSGNHYTVNAKVSSTPLNPNIENYPNKYIKLTCNRRSDQILRYEVYLNEQLVTSTYAEEQIFREAGYYRIYIQDIYGNEYSSENEEEELVTLVRYYPTVTWKYLGTDGKYHVYNPDLTDANGFTIEPVSDNQHKITASVKSRFSFSGDYEFEFIGTAPKYTKTIGTETVVTIEEGQSFTLKIYYKNHKDCYVTYMGGVDVTPPSISVSADLDVVRNGEYAQFKDWVSGNVGDVIVMDDLYYVLSEIASRTVSNGATVSSDIIRINSNDANGLSLIEVYLDGRLIKQQDENSDFSQIIVSSWGKYRVVAKDRLGNVSEFNFTNGMPDNFESYVDGEKQDIELHGYLNFEEIAGKHVYGKIDYGKTDFELNFKKNADVFMSVSASGKGTEIYGFRISDGNIYPLTYKIALDKNNNKSIVLDVGDAIFNTASVDFKTDKEYLISKANAYAVYASVDANKAVSIKVYAPADSSSLVSVGARVEATGSGTAFVCAELSKRSSNITLDGIGTQVKDDIRLNGGFIIDESAFDIERIASVKLYYSKLNDLDESRLEGKTNIYTSNREYYNDGFYLLIVRNHYGIERAYRISISRIFTVTSSVTFADGHEIYYSNDYEGTLYSNNEITLDLLDENVNVSVTRNGTLYSRYEVKKEGNITYIVFSNDGSYVVELTDAHGNLITKRLEINKSEYEMTGELLTGFNEKALKREDGYTNQKLSVNKAVCDSEGIYYLAIQYGEVLNVLYDAFAESPIATDEQYLTDVVGANGDGVYKVICRNRYGAVVTQEIHYRGTPTLKLERTIRSKIESEIYDLDYAIALGFWSNNTMTFSTDAKAYVFTVNGSVTECPRTLVFENAGDFGSFEYAITYIDEYGFEYSFKAYLVRKSVTADIPSDITGVEFDGILHTKNDISITFGENVYATYTRNNGEEVNYRSGEVLKKDGTYRFTVIDYAGNATMMTIKKDTAVEFSFVDAISESNVQNGGVVNTSKVNFNVLNKDSTYIESVVRNGVVQTDFSGSKFTEDGKWELILCDKLGNRAYFCFYIITRSQNGFAYTTPHEYRITEMWYDSGDGINVSYLSFVNHSEFTSSFNFTENGKYTAVMTSDVTGMTSTFEFTVNTNAPTVSLVGCGDGETTINDVTLTGYKVGDRIMIYREEDTGEKLVEEVEVTSLATKIPTITEGGKYRIVVESEAGVQTELSLVRKHVMNTAGSVLIMVIIGISVIGLFTGLVYRNKSKTDD